MYYDTEGIAGTALTGSLAWSTVAGRKPCEQTLHSLDYGIFMLAYFPLDIGALELGSNDFLFPANSDVITKVYSYNGGSARPRLVNPNIGNTLVTEPMSSPMVTDERSHANAPVTARKCDSDKREWLEHVAVVQRQRERL